MTLPTYVGTIPDGTALQVLAWINNGLAAAFSQCSSPTPPDNPVGWMQWGNSATGVAYVRDPQNVAWVPVGRFDAQSWVPYVATGTTGGVETGDSTSLGPYASLAAGEGFAAGHAGVASVRAITASDLPTVGATTAGITPVPSLAQAGHVLRPAGWSQLLQNFGVKLFAGQTNYVWSGFPQCSSYRFCFDLLLNGSQTAVIQIGANGTPSTTGYVSTLHRGYSPDGIVNRPEAVPLFIPRGAAVRVIGRAEITELSTNTYHISGISDVVASDYGDQFAGIVSLPGPMNYLRILTAGSPSFSYASQNLIASGQGKLMGL